MSKVKINSKRIVFQKEYETKRYFIPKNTGFVQYYYMDEAEDILVIKIFSKTELTQLLDVMEIQTENVSLNVINEYNYLAGAPNYNNTIEIGLNEEADFCDIILSLIDFCTKNNILLIQPKDDELNISKYLVWQRKQDDINWWKDDLVFRNFSRS